MKWCISFGQCYRGLDSGNKSTCSLIAFQILFLLEQVAKLKIKVSFRHSPCYFHRTAALLSFSLGRCTCMVLVLNITNGWCQAGLVGSVAIFLHTVVLVNAEITTTPLIYLLYLNKYSKYFREQRAFCYTQISSHSMVHWCFCDNWIRSLMYVFIQLQEPWWKLKDTLDAENFCLAPTHSARKNAVTPSSDREKNVVCHNFMHKRGSFVYF